MKLVKTNQWLALLSNIVVIAGVVFIYIEIRQNNEFLAAQDRYNRLDVATRGPWMIVEDADLTDALFVPADRDRNEVQMEVFQVYWDNIFKGFEWTFRELSLEEIPIERWAWNFDINPRIIEVWDGMKDQYDVDFVEYIEQHAIKR